MGECKICGTSVVTVATSLHNHAGLMRVGGSKVSRMESSCDERGPEGYAALDRLSHDHINKN